MKTLVSVVMLAVALFLGGCRDVDGGHNTTFIDADGKHRLNPPPPAPNHRAPAVAETVECDPPAPAVKAEQRSQLHLVTKYRLIRGAAEPQELTFVEFVNGGKYGLDYLGPMPPDIRLESGYVWGRVEIAGRNRSAPNDDSKATWLSVWTPVPADGQRDPR